MIASTDEGANEEEAGEETAGDAARPGGPAIKAHIFVAGWLAMLLVVAGCDAPPNNTLRPSNTTASSHSLSRTPQVAPYDVRLLSGGTEIELAGGMPDGTTAAVQRMLDGAPQVKVIHLNNLGGELSEGLKLERLIRDRRLITYSSATCDSACTIAFLAGRERYLATDAWLGFHSAARTLGGSSFAAGNKVMRDIYRSEGLPDTIIDRALATAPDEVWYPSHEDLLAAHAIDAVVDRKRFAPSGMPHWRDAAEVDATLQMTPFYAILADHDAERYALIRDTYLKGAQAGRSYQEIEAAATDILARKVMPFYLKATPDKPLRDFLQVMIEELEFQSKYDVKACVSSILLDSDTVGRPLPPDLTHREADIVTAVINAAIANPQEVDKAEAVREFKTLFQDLSRQSPEMIDVLIKPREHVHDPALLCNSFLTFLKAVDKLSDEHRIGLVMRFIFSNA